MSISTWQPWTDACSACGDAHAFALGRREEPTLEITLQHAPNVLDMIPTSKSLVEPSFVILTPDSLYFLHRKRGEWISQQIVPGRLLSSMAVCISANGKFSDVVVGTYQRSLLCISPKGEVQAELHLLDVPTALQVLRCDRQGKLIAVGLGQGGVAWYQMVSDEYLHELGTEV